MNSAPKILLPLLLLAGVAAGIYAYVGGDSSGPPPAPPRQADPLPDPATPDPVQPAASNTNDPTNETPPVNVRVEVPTTSDPDAMQGVRGRIRSGGDAEEEPGGDPDARVAVHAGSRCRPS